MLITDCGGPMVTVTAFDTSNKTKLRFGLADGLWTVPDDIKTPFNDEIEEIIHRDPFDRMLIAQAIAEDICLVSADDVIATYGAMVCPV